MEMLGEIMGIMRDQLAKKNPTTETASDWLKVEMREYPRWRIGEICALTWGAGIFHRKVAPVVNVPEIDVSEKISSSSRLGFRKIKKNLPQGKEKITIYFGLLSMM